MDDETDLEQHVSSARQVSKPLHQPEAWRCGRRTLLHAYGRRRTRRANLCDREDRVTPHSVVEERAGKGSPAWRRHELLTVIGDLLREDPVPARVRAALYRVAATIPGIRLLGPTHDGLGRPARAVALDDAFAGQRVEFLFDRAPPSFSASATR